MTVIPAQAGIQGFHDVEEPAAGRFFFWEALDPRLRGDDKAHRPGNGIRGLNFARLTEKNAFTLRTLASLVNSRCASAR